jgi:uncharacterized protein
MDNKKPSLVDQLIEVLSLERHPEGGFFRQTYRSTGEIPHHSLPADYSGDRAFSTAIYFLLSGDDFSAFHRILSDEVWHFYAGTSIAINMIYPDGRIEIIQLGPDYASGEVFQAVIPGGCWFAALLVDPDSYALVGCTVSPGFDFVDFELGERQSLIDAYPQHADVITRLTRN